MEIALVSPRGVASMLLSLYNRHSCSNALLTSTNISRTLNIRMPRRWSSDLDTGIVSNQQTLDHSIDRKR